METKFNKQETANLLQEYFEKLEGRKVKVSISAKKTLVGIYESESCKTTITVSEKMDIAGIEKEVTYELSEKDLSNHITALLALQGFDVESVELDDGISNRTVGYFMDEHTEKKAYCNGITVRLNRVKGKEYVKK